MTEYPRQKPRLTPHPGIDSGVLDTVTTLNSTTGITGNRKSWSLNAVGGWNSVSTNGTATGLTYDNNGNRPKNDQGFFLTYDAWNRMATDSNTTMTLRYDALGRWDYQNYASGTNLIYYDTGNHQIETWDGAVLLRDKHITAGNYGITGSGLSERLYANSDANWDTGSLLAPGGTVMERLIYDAYGNFTTLTGSWGSGTRTYYFRPTYQGTFWLGEANVYLIGPRLFDYTIGAWNQKDPAGYVDGVNVYQFTDSAPIAHVDPYGLSTLSSVKYLSYDLGATGLDMVVQMDFPQALQNLYLGQSNRTTVMITGAKGSRVIGTTDSFDIGQLKTISQEKIGPQDLGPGLHLIDTRTVTKALATGLLNFAKKRENMSVCSYSIIESGSIFLAEKVQVKTPLGWGDFNPATQLGPGKITQTNERTHLIFVAGQGSDDKPVDNDNLTNNTVLDIAAAGLAYAGVHYAWRIDGNIDGNSLVGTFSGVKWDWGRDFSGAAGSQAMDTPSRQVNNTV